MPDKPDFPPPGDRPSRIRLSAGVLSLVALLAALQTPSAGAAVHLDAPEDIAKLLNRHLAEETGNPRRLTAEIREILATEGYFSPEIRAEESDGDIRFHIEPGPRTHIREVSLTFDGPISPAARDALRAGWRLPVGAPFRQNDWNTAKQQVLSELLAVEFADAELADSSAVIDADAHTATLGVRYHTGPSYRFGALQAEGLARYSPALIERYNRSVKPGEPYRAERLVALQSALQATPYFTSVQATLDREHATASDDGTLTAPVNVLLREAPAHRVAFGAGASSNTGARVEANYRTPDLFRQAWEFDSGLRFEQKRQIAYADVFLPPDERFRRNSVGAMVEATDISGLRTSRGGFGTQTIQQRGRVEQRLSLHWETERREADGADPVTSRALVPNAMWTWRKVDSLLDPREGLVVQAQVGGGSKVVLSDENFVRLHGRVQAYWPLGRNDSLMLRAEGGRTFADSRLHIPQDYLFRTGGTGSVRGYSYQSLGIREGNAVVGGRYLAAFSAEATHWFNERWGVAAFIDAGDAVDSMKDARLAVGYGIGARWRSPAGPLGVDLAYGERTGELQVHFALSIPF